jgi:hypothetical protein
VSEIFTPPQTEHRPTNRNCLKQCNFAGDVVTGTKVARNLNRCYRMRWRADDRQGDRETVMFTHGLFEARLGKILRGDISMLRNKVFKRCALATAATVSVLGWIGAASAALVTSPAGFPTSTVIDFSAFAGCATFAQAGCSPPQTIAPGVQFTGTPGFLGASLYNGLFGLGSNGSWDSGRNGYVGINNQQNGSGIFARFTFSTPVSAVGVFENYAPGLGEPDPILEVLSSSNAVLESYDLAVAAPISTPGGVDAGAFRGVLRASADISAIEFIDGFQVVDNLTFGAAVVPVPTLSPLSSLALLVVAFAGFGLTRRRPG